MEVHTSPDLYETTIWIREAAWLLSVCSSWTKWWLVDGITKIHNHSHPNIHTLKGRGRASRLKDRRGEILQ